MIANKVLLKPEIQQQVELFYKISNFLSKYAVVIFAFVFSVLFMLGFSAQNEKVVAYSSNVLNFSSLESTFFWKQNPAVFNAKSKYLKAKYILSKTTIDGARLNLGWGLFTTPVDIQFPSYTLVNSVYLKHLSRNSIGKALNDYYAILLRSSYNPQVLKLKMYTKKWLTVSEMQQRYNLSCMDWIFNDSFFCNTNKFLLIKDIEAGRVDLSSEAYEKLFKNLFILSEDKCNILKKIYSNRLNYKNIIATVKENCNNADEFDIVKDLIEDSNLSLFSAKVPVTYEWQMHKLVNQWMYLLKTKNVSSDNILAHISYVKNLLNNGLIISNYLYLEYKILQNLKNRLQYQPNSSSLISFIDKLVMGDPAVGFKWIKSYIKDLISKSDKEGSDLLVVNNFNIESVREKFLSLLKGVYSKYFVLTEKPEFNKNMVTLVWNLQLSIKENQNIKKYSLPVELIVDLNSIIWQNFTIDSIKILDDKTNNYLISKWIKLPKDTDLIFLSSYLSNALSDYYLNWQKNVEIGFCDKARQVGFQSCSNNVISVQNNGKLNLSVQFVFDDNGRLISVKLPKKVTKQVEQSWVGNKNITVDLIKLSAYLNKKLRSKEYWLDDVNKIYSTVQEFIKKAILKQELKEIWMDAKQVVKVQSLFKKYLWVDLQKINHIKWNFYAIYFKLGKYNVRAIYNLATNKIVSISVYVQSQRKFVSFGKTSLLLGDLDVEKLNLFRQDPDVFLKNLNPKAYSQLQQLLEKSK